MSVSETAKLIPELSAQEKEALGAPPSGEDKSIREAHQLSSGLSEEELAKEAAASEHRRNEKFKDHFEKVAICTLYVVIAVLIVIGVVWLWHLLCPPRWHFLDNDQVNRLQALVTGAVISGVAANHINKRLR